MTVMPERLRVLLQAFEDGEPAVAWWTTATQAAISAQDWADCRAVTGGLVAYARRHGHGAHAVQGSGHAADPDGEPHWWAVVDGYHVDYTVAQWGDILPAADRAPRPLVWRDGQAHPVLGSAVVVAWSG